MLINKRKYNINNNKKVLHKIGKKWVTVSTLMLGLIGGATVAGNVSAHADTQPNQPSVSKVKANLNQKLNNPTSNASGSVKSAQPASSGQINQQAKALHANILVGNAKQSSTSNEQNNIKPASLTNTGRQHVLNNSQAQSKEVNVNNSAFGAIRQGSSKQDNTNSVVNSLEQKPAVNTESNLSIPNIKNSSVSAPQVKLASVNNPQASGTEKANNNNNKVDKKHGLNKLATNTLHIAGKNSSISDQVKQRNAWNFAMAGTAKKNIDTTPINGATYDKSTGKFVVNKQQTMNVNEPKVDSDNSNYFSGGIKTTGNDEGLNYTAYNNGGVEFTGGTAQSDLSNFLNNSDVKNGKAIEFDNDIDTSNVTNMSYMFESDSALQSVDLNGLNTSKVTNMSHMFHNDSALRSIDLSGLDTSKVTNMSFMFFNDSALQSVDLNGLNTSKVTNMSHMFYGDSALRSINLSGLNTSKVTDMSYMFKGDSNLQTLNLGNGFDTSNVTDMSDMFRDNSDLQTLNLGNGFDTSKVTNMSDMFWGDSNLQTLNLGNGFDTSKVFDMSDMFFGDSALRSINLSGLDTSNVTYMDDMFAHDSDLQSIDIQSINTKFNPDVSLPTMYKETGQKDGNGKPYTLTTPNDFSKGNVGTFTTHKNPQPITYSDIYGSIDGKTAPKSLSSNQTSSNSWTFVNLQGQEVDSSIKDNNGNILVAPEDDGLIYQYNKNNNTVEFTGGTANSNLSDFLNNSDVRNAKTIKFDNNVNTNHTTNMSNMFKSDTNLTSLIFHNNLINVSKVSSGLLGGTEVTNGFDTSNVTNMSGMFEDTTGLNSLTLPSSFNTNKVTSMNNMFGGSGLQSLTVQSPNTKLNSNANLPMYKETGQRDRNGKPYTSSALSNFSKGNIGTFTKDKNPQIVTDGIRFETTNGSDVGDIQVQGPQGNKFSFSDNHNENLKYVPDGFSLSNSNQSFTFGTYNSNDVNTDAEKYHVVKVVANQNNIPLDENAVDIEGSVILHFKNNDGEFTKLPLNYLTQSYPQSDTNLLATTSYGNNNKDITPSDLLNNIGNITVNGKNIQANQFKYTNGLYHYQPQMNDVKAYHGSTPIIYKNIDLYFDAKNNATENIQYTYNGSNVNRPFTISGSDNSIITESNASIPTKDDKIIKSNLSLNEQEKLKKELLFYSDKIHVDSAYLDNDVSLDNTLVNASKSNTNPTYKAYFSSTISKASVAFSSTSSQLSLESSLNKSYSDDLYNHISGHSIPTGYNLANPTANITINNGSATIPLVQSQVADTVHFSNGNNNVGNGSTASGNYNSDIQPDEINNVPSGYHLASNPVYKFGGNSSNAVNISVAPDTEHEDIDFYYNHGGKNVLAGHAYVEGNYGNNIQVDSVYAKNNGLNSDYSLASSGDNFTFGQNGDAVSIAVVPVQKDAEARFITNSGIVVNASGLSVANNTSMDLGSGNPSDVINVSGSGAPTSLSAPTNYHILNPSQVIRHDNHVSDIVVAPNSVTETINFKDDKGNTIKNQTTGQSDTASLKGIYGTKGIYANQNLPQGYHIASDGSNNFTFNNDNNSTHTVTLDKNSQGDVTGIARIKTVYNIKGHPNQTRYSYHYLPISGHLNDGDITISPNDHNFQEAGFKNDGDQDFIISFKPSDVDAHDFGGDRSRYNVSDTFTYTATPVDVKINFTDNDNKNNKVGSNDLGTIGIPGQYIDIQNDGTDNTNDENKVDALTGEGLFTNNTSFDLPSGYRLNDNHNILTVEPSTDSQGNIQTNNQGYPIMLLSLNMNLGGTKPNNSQPNSGNQPNNKPNKPVQPNKPNTPNKSNNQPSNNNVSDVIQFVHGSRVVKVVNKNGKKGTQFNIDNLIPAGYIIPSNDNNIILNGGVHNIDLGVNRPYGNSSANVIPLTPSDLPNPNPSSSNSSSSSSNNTPVVPINPITPSNSNTPNITPSSSANSQSSNSNSNSSSASSHSASSANNVNSINNIPQKPASESASSSVTPNDIPKSASSSSNSSDNNSDNNNSSISTNSSIANDNNQMPASESSVAPQQTIPVNNASQSGTTEPGTNETISTNNNSHLMTSPSNLEQLSNQVSGTPTENVEVPVSKLPKTGENDNVSVLLISIASILASLGLAGVDLNKKSFN